VDRPRYLTIIADDYGIGPATSQGILDLAARRRLNGAVMLVNSPHVESAVRAWRQAGRPLELGWHPCLTLDRPILSAHRVPSLVDGDGRFHPLGAFVKHLLTGRIAAAEIEAEFRAQHRRFCDLIGHPPTFVSTHHHIQVFPPVGTILLDLLKHERPYLRKVCEPWRMLLRVPGALTKRTLLTVLGRRLAQQQDAAGLPGNDWLAGITDPPLLRDPRFFTRWVRRVPGQIVELSCHPGHIDPTLIGRDCTLDDGMLQRRVRELQLLRQPRFLAAVYGAGFTLVPPSQVAALHRRRSADAA
jgi:predicted glycoside hydrolase/deacetylase ChbG (UPF0249 family)